LVNAQYDLTLERQTTMDNILFIPGIANPVSEINSLLFGQGQPGGSWIPTLSAAMIAANTFGSGVEDILDLSGNNNPFSQATSGSRAAWFREPKRGRVNLLLDTVSLTPVPWQISSAGTGVTPIRTTGQLAPDGTNTAIRLQFNTGAGGTSGDRSSLNLSLTLPLGNYVSEVFIKPLDATTDAQILSYGTFAHWVAGTNPVSSVIDSTGLSDGWRRLRRLATPNVTSGQFRLELLGNSASTFDVLVWHPQLEAGSTHTAYQRVTTAFDVTEAGQRDCYGVRFDGTDDWYERAINFSGTDKVTLFVAMRRRSDAARGTVLELTSSIDSNNGAFHLTAPNAASATFGFESKGTTLRDAVITQAMGNPRIITAIGDIAGDLASIQVDNGTPTTNTGDQGSGNYANSTLYLGRRGGSSLSLNGDIFGVIAAGGEYTAATRQRVRTILSRTTPTVNL
jgi:hypothetical protein